VVTDARRSEEEVSAEQQKLLDFLRTLA